MQNKHAWSMAAEGIQLYYGLLEFVGPYDILNIHAWIMVAEDVVLILYTQLEHVGPYNL